MGKLSVRNKPVAAVERLLETVRLTGLERLEAVLACTFTFDSGYFDQLLQALAECHPEGSDLLRAIPIDVVCDHRHYRGHTGHYNVHCWPGNNLFHPKLVALLIADRIVWIEGSLNMTRPGYMLNRELVTYHESRQRKLPRGIQAMVQVLSGQRVHAAKRISDATTGVRTDPRNRSVTSLDNVLLDGLLTRVKDARGVYIVAPFLDQRERAGPTIESAALRVLANRYAHATFRIFLPEFARPDGRMALQGSKSLFTQVFGSNPREDRIAFCGVPSHERPLHAKLLALRHGKGGARATVLTGSPNLTENALLKKGVGANVELAREMTIRWKEVDELVRPLGRKFKALSKCLFQPPQTIAATAWHVLKSATYHPLSQELDLEWRRPDFAAQTRLCYAGARLDMPAQGPVRAFAIRDGELRLETVCRANPSRRSWCPIVIPLGSRLALAELPSEGDPPPEWWLAQLGALPPPPTTRDTPPKIGRKNGSDTSAIFALGERVRDLAERMRYATEVITKDDGSELLHITAHLDLLVKIFDSHDPSSVSDLPEQAWRMWVRLEISQVLALATTRHTAGGRRARRVRSLLRRRLSASPVPQELNEQWRTLTAALS